MKRFNLLLVTGESGLREVALKALSKVHRSNFVFEMPNMAEATRLLSKLNIDMALIDLDKEPVDLVQLSQRVPNMRVIGLSAVPARVTAKINPAIHQVIEKRDFAASFLAELKDQKKTGSSPAPLSKRAQQAPAESKDFSDFALLNRSVKQ
ncbi:MAG: hypothetical protein U0176_27370 [Bacteroidia bacterium]